MEASDQRRIIEALILASPEPITLARLAQIVPDLTPGDAAGDVRRSQHPVRCDQHAGNPCIGECLPGSGSCEQVLTQLGIYQEDLDMEERLILRVARLFGECEVDLPEGFVGEVKRCINKWKSTRRFSQAINRARSNDYIGEIVRRMQEQDLAPQFFYIALQESDFRLNACGPPTRYGYAKGMWQFIPMTAKDYGLKVGPREKDPVADPQDERHDFEKATQAAARYIRRIYDTDAQASGLLVIASYNWGERRVADLIRRMPDNPRDRNFWRLMEDHIDQFPDETYDYVFSIFSAAVIGEDPRHFGFDFDNPLQGADTAFAAQE